MAHTHRAQTTQTRPYAGSVSRDENRAAHGNITLVERCACGAERLTNANGRHTEQGEWDLPEWAADVHPDAVAFTAGRARKYLVALCGSTVGRLAVESAGYGAIVDVPERGTDASTLQVARAAYAHMPGRHARERTKSSDHN